jgi:peptidoglycan/xylan/chitin deacetylase (PgdA/CDA1 family)
MRVVGAKTLVRFAGWLRSRATGGGLILGYHRIAEPSDDPYGITVTPRHFAEQLELLARCARPMRLQAFCRAAAEGRLPQGAVALTFDDGYADNLYIAKPLLERFDIPATIFVSTSFLGREYWWDELADLVLTSALTQPLRLRAGQHSFSWSPRGSADPKLRRKLLRHIYLWLLPLEADQRTAALAQLRAGLQPLPPAEQPLRRGVTPEELLRLAAGGLIEIGAHTVSHPALGGLPAAAQRDEVQPSKAHLERLLGEPVLSFSYPNGSLSATTVRLVREAGFTCACQSRTALAWRGSDRFQLPRLWPQDQGGAQLARRLRRWNYL